MCVLSLLVGGGEADLLTVKVKDGVESADEDVSQNPSRADGGIEVKSHESRNASRAGNQNVISTSEIELTARNDERDHRKGVQVGASVPNAFAFKVGLATKLSVDDSNVLRRTSQKTGARVAN